MDDDHEKNPSARRSFFQIRGIFFPKVIDLMRRVTQLVKLFIVFQVLGLVPAMGKSPFLETFEAAVAAINEEDYQKAEELAKIAIGLSGPDDLPAARNLHGIALSKIGEIDGAIACFKLNAELDPENPIALVNWAQMLRIKNQSTEAIPLMEKALGMVPDSMLYGLQWRLARIEAGEDEAVGRLAMPKLSEVPVAPEWLLTAAAVALHREAWQEARILLEQARTLLLPAMYAEMMMDPAFSRHAAREELAGMFPRRAAREAPGKTTIEAVDASMQGRYREALVMLDAAEAAGEAKGPILTLRGFTHMQMGEFAASAAAFRAAIERNPNDASLYLNLGEALRAGGQLQEASEVFQKGLSIEPGHELMALKLAFTMVAGGRANEVLDTGLKAITQGPLMLGKAAAALALDRIDEAMGYVDQAKASMPESAFVAMLKDPIFKTHHDDPKLAPYFKKR